jgi:hypothetical protein
MRRRSFFIEVERRIVDGLRRHREVPRLSHAQGERARMRPVDDGFDIGVRQVIDSA